MMDIFESKDSDWKAFLRGIAAEVGQLILLPKNLKKFRMQIAPYAKKRQEYQHYQTRCDQSLSSHWEKVKSNPRLKDKDAGSPEEGWEWDSDYLWGAAGDKHVVVNGVLLSDKPEMQMPACLGKEYISSVETHIKQMQEDLEECTRADVKNENKAKAIKNAILDDAKKIEMVNSQLKELDPEDISKAWIGVSLSWWKWLGLDAEEVFGCWRPPPEDPVPDPYTCLWDTQVGDMPIARNETEAYQRYYIFLTVIHDILLPDIKISKGIWSQTLLWSLWCTFKYGPDSSPGEHYLKDALCRVKADLAQPPKGIDDALGALNEGKIDKVDFAIIRAFAEWRNNGTEKKTRPSRKDLEGKLRDIGENMSLSGIGQRIKKLINDNWMADPYDDKIRPERRTRRLTDVDRDNLTG